MKADVETRLVDDGVNWIASNDYLKASGRTLPELDRDMKRALRECGRFTGASSVVVFMGFDFSQIPIWLRQYAYHYFNRFVTVDLQGQDEER